MNSLFTCSEFYYRNIAKGKLWENLHFLLRIFIILFAIQPFIAHLLSPHTGSLAKMKSDQIWSLQSQMFIFFKLFLNN